jgi:hypothetical protein
MDILDSLRKCIRPIIFDTGCDDYPCSTIGTAFIVGFRQSVFVLTAEHVVKGWPVEKLLIYPSWNSQYTFRYLNWGVVKTTPEDIDTSDILIIKADLNDVPMAERRNIQLLNLNDRENVVWFEERYDSQFFLCGFPEAASGGVDYSTLEIKTSQYLLEGVYKGNSISPCCHMIEVKNPLSLNSFNGLSGSPVFSHRRDNTVGTPARFCGMALRGTAISGYIHFLAVEVLFHCGKYGCCV